MENLGYGSRFTVDGFLASERLLADGGVLKRLVTRLAGNLEPCSDRGHEATLDEADGVSVAAICAESQIVLHAFPAARALNLHLFTRRDVPLTALLGLLGEELEAGRYESHLSSVGRIAPADDGELARMLAGDRGYARARLLNNYGG